MVNLTGVDRPILAPPHGEATGSPVTEALAPRVLGPLLAALIVLLAALPGLVRMPTLDRDEARFAQSTAQMLESGDVVDPRFQDEARDKKPVGINWLQAGAVRLTSSEEAREIWAYRLPSLLGGMAAAAACAWGARAFFKPWRAASAGVALGCGFLLTSEAFTAKTDAILCAAVALSMAAFARIYMAARRGETADRRTRAVFWLGLGVGLMVKGPVAPLVVILAGLALWVADRGAPWMRRMSWRWGLLFLLALAGPWAAAITVSGDGAFWTRAMGGDVLHKLTGAREGHRGAPGYYLLLAPVLMFPATALIPAALAYGWGRHKAPAARFALAWLVPAWLLFEAAPTKLPHYALPLYGGFALLAAGALGHPMGRLTRWGGAGLSLLASAAIATLTVTATSRFGGAAAAPVAALAVLLTVGAGVSAAIGVIVGGPGSDLGRRLSFLCAATGMGIAAHVTLSAGLLPMLSPLWPSRAAAEMVSRHGVDPRNGVTPGPVAVAGYAEPSLVFALGTDTDLGDGSDAALAVETGRPALVEGRQLQPFLDRLRRDRIVADRLGQVGGFDYSNGKAVSLSLWLKRR
ncbi:glycosyltransferase family 39 protein [Caulobacter sp. S45]|uniref:ArnT family glycosyltransferase n=1 Tax=Caulobacter sp. S45 TaxID=1641861 RepID=UPI00131E8987|nr:glycosyltransferase family 39 protein [Caulobacter sp. S45]